MSRNFKYRTVLPGMTLTEVLVMMIIAGVVFLCAMDGFGLFRRYTSETAGRITADSRFYDGYYRLEDIVTNSDSITSVEADCTCWRNGVETVLLTLHDSVLVALYGSIRDTLILNVGNLRVAHNPDNYSSDSLVVILHRDHGSLTISFSTKPPVQIVTTQRLEDKEKDYMYE